MTPHDQVHSSSSKTDWHSGTTTFTKISGVLLLSLIFMFPAAAWSSENLVPIYQLLLSSSNDQPKRIFILGSSTVHAAWFRSASFNDPYGDNRVLEGWGEQLDKYMKDPSKVYNRARSGSDSVSYRSPDNNRPGTVDRHWANTEALINATADGNGGFILIQFGANDSHPLVAGGPPRVSVEDFENELRTYVDDARILGLTPVLVSPPGARSHGVNTRPYAQYIEPIAIEKDALFIDLYEKSKTQWLTYDADGNGDLPEADKLFSYVQRHSGINNTHYGRIGAKIVSGWFRELACGTFDDRSQAVQTAAAQLCEQFVQGELEHDITMREDAEDGDTAHWETYDTTDGSTVTNVYDATKRSNVIVLQGNDGLANGFRYDNSNPWGETLKRVVSWQMQYSEDFTFFVAVDTEDGYKTFEYQPTSNPGEITASGRYNFGLGTDANDGTWHTFTRDLQADLQFLAPGKHILEIHRIAIRGSGRVDNIRTMSSIDTVSRDIAPTVAVVGEAEITITKDSDYADQGVTVVDDKDGDIVTQLEIIGLVDAGTVGTYTIHYKVHDSAGNGGYATRTVHVVEAGAETVVVHEDAEDGDTQGWNTYATTEGSTVTNVEDNGNRVIRLQGNNGLNNGFSFTNLNIDSGFVVSWRLNYSEAFRFFVQVNTADTDGLVYMEYTPDNISTGLNNNFIHHGLGTDAMDGTWHTFTRDIEADLNVIYPNDHITRIVGFSIRGSGLIDDISTSTRAARETFSYNGHTYTIVKTALSWQDARIAANEDGGGYLANISSIAENHEIYSRLYRYITQGEYPNTVASNGGNASYVWIGGNDLEIEGTWRWQNNNSHFWTGTQGGNAEGGLFSNWGRNTNEVQSEPDDTDGQDAAGIALTRWPINSGSLGQASQWNDLIAEDMLYYIVEHD